MIGKCELRLSATMATAVIAAGLLAGCGWVEISPRHNLFAAKNSATAPAVATNPQASRGAFESTAASTVGSVVVARGDSVHGLSRQHGVSARAIIEANNLRPPYLLKVGQQVVLPLSRSHVVRRGDSLYSVSRQYGIDSFSLANANGLTADYAVQPGQTLMIPGAGEVAVASASTRPIETPYGSSSVPAAAPVRASGGSIPAPDRPSLVDVPVRAEIVAPPTAAPVADQPSVMPAIQPVEISLPEYPTQVAVVAPRGLTAPKLPEPALLPQPPVQAPPPATAPQPAVVSAPPARSGGFLWPVSGKVVSTFGSKGSGLHNDGINIEAPRGTPIRAAENGVVAYAGNEIRGFGNMLLIKHEDGWITAYAHADSLLVKRGDKVKKGDMIARVGSTGTVDRPQLHFEMRKGKRAVDPQSQLKS